MTDQQKHLSSAVEQQKTLAAEIQDLNMNLSVKKEQFLKLQGIVEYLTGNGVTLETTIQEEEIAQ